jgi:hypothetical protein
LNGNTSNESGTARLAKTVLKNIRELINQQRNYLDRLSIAHNATDRAIDSLFQSGSD